MIFVMKKSCLFILKNVYRNANTSDILKDTFGHTHRLGNLGYKTIPYFIFFVEDNHQTHESSNLIEKPLLGTLPTIEKEKKTWEGCQKFCYKKRGNDGPFCLRPKAKKKKKLPYPKEKWMGNSFLCRNYIQNILEKN